MKKKVISILLVVVFAVVGFGCGQKTISDEEFAQMTSLSENEMYSMYSDIESYIGQRVDFYGVVFDIEIDEDGDTILQVWQDIENYDNNTVVVIYGSTDIKEDDYLFVSGLVSSEFTGTNMFGGEVTAPVVTARSYEITDYIAAVAPTQYTIDVGKTIDQYGLKVTLNKIEFAESETRVYLTILNDTSEEASFYKSSSYLIQNKTQYEYDYNYEYENMPSDIQPGVEISGIVVFPAIDHTAGPIKAQIYAYYWDWDVDFEDYIFSGLE